MRVIGIDPGTLHVGYGVVEDYARGFRRVASGTINAKGADVAGRLAIIFRELQERVVEYRPQSGAIETAFAGENIRTAIIIGEARGVAMLACTLNEIPVVGYEPTLIKRAVAGNGRASKDQVLQMIKILLNLSVPPKTDHEADALAIAITHLRRQPSAKFFAAK